MSSRALACRVVRQRMRTLVAGGRSVMRGVARAELLLYAFRALETSDIFNEKTYILRFSKYSPADDNFTL